jgi:hypothetical protein
LAVIPRRMEIAIPVARAFDPELQPGRKEGVCDQLRARRPLPGDAQP